MTDFTSEPTKRRRGSVFKTFARKRRRQQQMIRESNEGVNDAPAHADERTPTASTANQVPAHTNDDDNVVPPDAAEQGERLPNPTSTTATLPEALPQTDDAIPASSSSHILLSNLSSDSKSSEDGNENDYSTTKPKGWTCERCTLWNEMKNRRCTVCNSRRPPADKLQQQASVAAVVVAKTPRAGGEIDATNDKASGVGVSHVVKTQKSDSQKAKRNCKVDAAKALEGSLVADGNETAENAKDKLHSTMSANSWKGSKTAESINKINSPSSASSSGHRKKVTTGESPPKCPKDDSSQQPTLNENQTHSKQPKKDDLSKPQAAQEYEISERGTTDTNRINEPAPSPQQNPSISSTRMLPPLSNLIMAPTEPGDENASNSTRKDRDASRLVREDSSRDNVRNPCLEAKLDKVLNKMQRIEDMMELLLQDKFDGRINSLRDETKPMEPDATVAKPARVSNVGANTPKAQSRESLTVASLDTVTNDGTNHGTKACGPPEHRQVPKTNKPTSEGTLEDQREAPREEPQCYPASNRSKSVGSYEKVSAPVTHLEKSQAQLSCPSPAASTQTIDPDPHCASAVSMTLDFSSKNATRVRNPPSGGPHLDFVPTTATRQNRNLEPSASRPTAPQGVTTNNKSSASKSFQPLKNSTNANPKQPPPSAGDDGWISNKSTREFLREMDAGVTPTNADAKGEWLEARSVRTTTTTRNAPPTRQQPGRDALWDESQEPGYAYKETVRCKAVREGLPCHDCEQCRKFYQTLKVTGHEFSQDPIHFSRHRSRFAPSETPVDFWELDFIDERDAERQRRQSEGQK